MTLFVSERKIKEQSLNRDTSILYLVSNLQISVLRCCKILIFFGGEGGGSKHDSMLDFTRLLKLYFTQALNSLRVLFFAIKTFYWEKIKTNNCM